MVAMLRHAFHTASRDVTSNISRLDHTLLTDYFLPLFHLSPPLQGVLFFIPFDSSIFLDEPQHSDIAALNQ